MKVVERMVERSMVVFAEILNLIADVAEALSKDHPSNFNVYKGYYKPGSTTPQHDVSGIKVITATKPKRKTRAKVAKMRPNVTPLPVPGDGIQVFPAARRQRSSKRRAKPTIRLVK